MAMSRTALSAVPLVVLLITAAVAVSQPRDGRPAGQADAPPPPPRGAEGGATAAPPVEAPANPQGTRPATQPSADDVLGPMLKPRRAAGERELVPTEAPVADRKSGAGSVSPHAPTQTVLREGTAIINRVGRLVLGADGAPSEFVFESDGGALRDPPLIVLPNLKLMIMEDTTRGNTREPRFRVSGVVTEYRGRNYLLLDKVYTLSPTNQQVR